MVKYIDRQFNGHFQEFQQTYRDGTAAADRLAGGSFASVPRGRQVAILQQVEKGQDTRPFFDLVVAHSMQGSTAAPGTAATVNM